MSRSGTRSASPRRVAQPSTTYEPGDPTTVLYGIVRDHFETFRTQAASLRDGDGLPKFVEQARGPLPRGTEALAACELRPDGCVLVAFGPLVSRLRRPSLFSVSLGTRLCFRNMRWRRGDL